MFTKLQESIIDLLERSCVYSLSDIQEELIRQRHGHWPIEQVFEAVNGLLSEHKIRLTRILWCYGEISTDPIIDVEVKLNNH